MFIFPAHPCLIEVLDMDPSNYKLSAIILLEKAVLSLQACTVGCGAGGSPSACPLPWFPSDASISISEAVRRHQLPQNASHS